MNLVHTHIVHIVSQDFLIKSQIKKTKKLPLLRKVSISAQFNQDFKKPALILLEVLSMQKAFITQSSVNSLSLSLRKGDLVGCKIVLRKKAAITFFQHFILEVFPLIKNNLKYNVKNKSVQMQVKDVFIFEPAALIYNYLQKIKTLDLNFELNVNNSLFFSACKLTK